MVSSLDYFQEEGGTVLDIFSENLEQISFFIVVNQNL